MEPEVTFPRHLYKKGGPYLMRKGLTYDCRYVTNEEEFKEALLEGFIDDLKEAVFGVGETNATEEEEEF